MCPSRRVEPVHKTGAFDAASCAPDRIQHRFSAIRMLCRPYVDNFVDRTCRAVLNPRPAWLYTFCLRKRQPDKAIRIKHLRVHLRAAVEMAP